MSSKIYVFTRDNNISRYLDRVPRGGITTKTHDTLKYLHSSGRWQNSESRLSLSGSLRYARVLLLMRQRGKDHFYQIPASDHNHSTRNVKNNGRTSSERRVALERIFRRGRIRVRRCLQPQLYCTSISVRKTKKTSKYLLHVFGSSPFHWEKNKVRRWSMNDYG